VLEEVLPLLPRETVLPARNDLRNRLKVLGEDSLFTRFWPVSVQPAAALSQAGLVAMVSLWATKTSASALTVKLTRVAPVKALESLAVRIHSEPATSAGTAVKVKARSPYWVTPTPRAGWMDQSAALAASFTTMLVMSGAAAADSICREGSEPEARRPRSTTAAASLERMASSSTA
jgi:hypothetical protein